MEIATEPNHSADHPPELPQIDIDYSQRELQSMLKLISQPATEPSAAPNPSDEGGA
jgi:hypothetical protein